MMDTLSKVHVALARETLDCFERRKDDRWFLRGNAEDWMTAMCADAHGTLLPNDWSYAAVVECLSVVEQAGAGADAWDLRAEPDVYNTKLLAWLGSSLQRAEFCDEAQEDGMVADDADMWTRIAAGQSQELAQVMGAVLDALEARADQIAEIVAETAEA